MLVFLSATFQHHLCGGPWHDNAMVMFPVLCFWFVFVGLWWICTVALVVFIRTGGRGGEDDKMTVGEGSVLVLYWQA